MVPQSWITDCLKMYKISDEVIKFIVETMKNWTMELTVGGKSIAAVKIQWYIPGRCAITITIGNPSDTTQSHT